MILDLALTRFGREGLEVLRSIRSRIPGLPVIILSGNIAPDVEDLARELRADAVLMKPQPLEDLVALAEGLIQRRR